MLNALFDVVVLSQEEVCNCTESHPVSISHGNAEYTILAIKHEFKHAQTRIIMKQC